VLPHHPALGEQAQVPDDVPTELAPSGRRVMRWTASHDVPGAARSLGIAVDGTAVVAYDPPRGVSGAPMVQVRTGIDLERVVATYPGVGAPVAVSPDGKRFVGADTSWSSRVSKLPHGARIVELGDGSEGVRWSLSSLFGWLSPTDLVALTRHPFGRKSPPAGPAAETLDALEAAAGPQVVVADVATGRVTPHSAAPVLGETIYVQPNLAAVDGLAVVASCHRLIGVPLDGGPPRWVRPPEGDDFHFVGHWYASASSACGRFVAFGSNHWKDHPNLLVVEATTGQPLLAVDTRSFGTDAAVRALAFHPTGWLAVGLGDGQVRHVTLAGSVLAYRGLPGSLSTLAFTPGAEALLLGGASQRGLRRIELTPSERGPSGGPPG
jgi:hypothetical protein